VAARCHVPRTFTLTTGLAPSVTAGLIGETCYLQIKALATMRQMRWTEGGKRTTTVAWQ